MSERCMSENVGAEGATDDLKHAVRLIDIDPS